MKLCLAATLCLAAVASAALAQQPAGAEVALQNLATERATHTAFSLDRDTVQAMMQAMNPDAAGPAASINSVTVENFRFKEPAFYTPEAMQALVATYRAAGFTHLVNQSAGPSENASPSRPLTDLWLHWHHGQVDAVTVLVRGTKQMTVLELAGSLRPLDLVHLSGKFGIPRIDPDAVMVPAPDGK